MVVMIRIGGAAIDICRKEELVINLFSLLQLVVRIVTNRHQLFLARIIFAKDYGINTIQIPVLRYTLSTSFLLISSLTIHPSIFFPDIDIIRK